jgi:hypothetical protein
MHVVATTELGELLGTEFAPTDPSGERAGVADLALAFATAELAHPKRCFPAVLSVPV